MDETPYLLNFFSYLSINFTNTFTKKAILRHGLLLSANS